MLQWDDTTIGYFGESYVRLPFTCGVINYPGTVLLGSCQDGYNTAALCERDESSTEAMTVQNDAPRRPGVQLPVPSDSTVDVAHTVCPSGHWTHEFLACDVLSACWRQDSFRLWSGSKIKRTMTSSCLFPFTEMFTCTSGVGRVPYSLVCDHGQDCPDNSDEDFCGHPSCNGAGQFQCSNKQASLFFLSPFASKGPNNMQVHFKDGSAQTNSRQIRACCHTEREEGGGGGEVYLLTSVPFKVHVSRLGGHC